MVHFMEVSFFEEFVVSGLSFLRHDHCIVELLNQLLVLILEHFIFEVGVGYLFTLILAVLDVLVPLFLEGLQSFGHIALNEEIANEVIDHF